MCLCCLRGGKNWLWITRQRKAGGAMRRAVHGKTRSCIARLSGQERGSLHSWRMGQLEGAQYFAEVDDIWRTPTAGEIIASGGGVVQVIALRDVIEWVQLPSVIGDPVECGGRADKLLMVFHQSLIDQGQASNPDGGCGAGAAAGFPLSFEIVCIRPGIR